MRSLAAALLISACAGSHVGDDDAGLVDGEMDGGTDASTACLSLTVEEAGSSALAAWIGAPPDPSELYSAWYASLFTGTDSQDLFVPLTIVSVDRAHVSIQALVASDYASCVTPDGPTYDCPGVPTAALAEYLIRLDETLPMATLVRAEPIANDDARARFTDVPNRLEEFPLCNAVGNWDVWSIPAVTFNGHRGAECYEYVPPAFASVFLVNRASHERWAISLPVLPGACADTWGGTGMGMPCTPTLGYATGGSQPHTLAFVGSSPVPTPGMPYRYSCALEAMCLGTCAGCWSSPYTEGVCIADLDATWMREVCAATSLDAIPIPVGPFECRRACATPTCSAERL
jgi:hypothetical protein